MAGAGRGARRQQRGGCKPSRALRCAAPTRLQAVLIRGASHAALQLQHHARVILDGYHALARRQQLHRQVAGAGPDFQHHVGALHARLLHDAVHHQRVLQDVLPLTLVELDGVHALAVAWRAACSAAGRVARLLRDAARGLQARLERHGGRDAHPESASGLGGAACKRGSPTGARVRAPSAALANRAMQRPHLHRQRTIAGGARRFAAGLSR